MKEPTTNLEQLVIESNPSTQVTYEIVKQLDALIPIKSVEQLKEYVSKQGLKVCGTVVPADPFLSSLTEATFPISNTRELVSKVAGAVRVAAEIMVRTDQIPENEDQARLVMTLAREPQKQAVVAISYFAGPSLFGSKRAK